LSDKPVEGDRPRRRIGEDFKRGSDGRKRNAWFLALVRESMIAGDAWVISSPGSDVVTIETLTTSGFPDDLKRRGYPLVEIEPGLRILHTTYHQADADCGEWRAGAGNRGLNRAGQHDHSRRRPAADQAVHISGAVPLDPDHHNQDHDKHGKDDAREPVEHGGGDHWAPSGASSSTSISILISPKPRRRARPRSAAARSG
jgi:hypothetical protein